MNEAEQNEMDAIAKSRSLFPESSAEDDMEKMAEQLSNDTIINALIQQQMVIIFQLQPRALKFRRIFRQYLDDGLEFDEAKQQAIRDFKELQILRDTNSYILDYLDFRKRN